MAAPRVAPHSAPVVPGPDEATPAPPDVPRLVALGAALAGLAVAIYLSVVHLTTAVPLYCSASGVVNCEQVVTSPASVVLGIPIAFYGVAWFVMMALLLAWPAGRSVAMGRLAWAAIGALTVLYLVYAELFVIGAICLWCSAVHALVLLIFALHVLFPRAAEGEPD